MSLYMSEYLYTPQRLQEERSDLNATGSWYSVIRSEEPDPAYFHIDGPSNAYFTPDGWPSESFVEQDNGKRVFAGFGQIDPQMQDYDLSADVSTIFSPGYLQSSPFVTTDNTGEIESGCFYSRDVHSVSNINNSWAISGEGFNFGGPGINQLQITLNKASNLTYCGISPLLNQTLGNVTADQDYGPYADYVQSTIWSWGSDEPSQSKADTDTQNRCAVINANLEHWQTGDCSEAHHSACRTEGQPYLWAISELQASYTQAGAGCRDSMYFAVPRTSLENRYLLQKWRQFIASNDVNDELLWVNFNDLDVKGCWVAGQNETCPYQETMDNNRNYLVPAIAAVIVFILTLLTIFVKCAAGRQQSKRRRRRGVDGWDYEGVPS